MGEGLRASIDFGKYAEYLAGYKTKQEIADIMGLLREKKRLEFYKLRKEGEISERDAFSMKSGLERDYIESGSAKDIDKEIGRVNSDISAKLLVSDRAAKTVGMSFINMNGAAEYVLDYGGPEDARKALDNMIADSFERESKKFVRAQERGLSKTDRKPEAKKPSSISDRTESLERKMSRRVKENVGKSAIIDKGRKGKDSIKRT